MKIIFIDNISNTFIEEWNNVDIGNNIPEIFLLHEGEYEVVDYSFNWNELEIKVVKRY